MTKGNQKNVCCWGVGCMTEAALQKLNGAVEHIVYSSEDTGFTVLELDNAGELVTVVGVLPSVAPGEELVLTGRYVAHPSYGHQFKAELCERALPATASAIRKYLASGAIKGVGPKLAVRIVEKFGEKALEVIEKDPRSLSQVEGISPKKANAVSQAYRQIFGIRSVMLFLTKYSVEPSAAIRAWKQWGIGTVEAVTENPYILCGESVGVPFAAADDIASRLELEADSPQRIRAGLCHVLTHNLSNGHTCLPWDRLVSAAVSLLDLDHAAIEGELGLAITEDAFIRWEADGSSDFIYLPDMYESEAYIAGRIGLMLDAPPPSDQSDRTGQIAALEQGLGIEYARLQRTAISMAMDSNIFILTGGPGTGKTTALNGILTLLERDGKKVALAAPTGRAAKRMSELCGREAKTIHRLLEVDFRDENNPGIQFKRNEKNPLRQDAIILDEASMIDTRLLHSLMRAMKLNVKLILVGDPDQLPSVGPGNILRDLIDSDIIPMVHLSEIFRQARESAIVSNAHRIVKGDVPDLGARDSDFFFLPRPSNAATLKTLIGLCTERLPKAYGYSPLWDIQVIVPSRIGALGTVELNKTLQEALNPPKPGAAEYTFGSVILREHDKVMQVRNNYDITWQRENGEEGTGVFNGDIGVIEMIDRPSRTILVKYDDRTAEYNFDMADEMEHAYAITVHKSQGSEFEAVLMPLMAYNQKLYYRNILYTAVTRAKKLMIVLGQPETVARMVANHRKVLRYTNLGLFLEDCITNTGGAL